MQPTVLLFGGIDPRVERFHTDSHSRVVRELDREPAADLFRGPATPHMRDHPVNERVVGHPVRLVRTGSSTIRMQLSLTWEIEPFVPVTRIQFVAQVRAQIRMVVFWPPRVPVELSADRRTVNTEPARDLSI